jgi:hypothetical protein
VDNIQKRESKENVLAVISSSPEMKSILSRGYISGEEAFQLKTITQEHLAEMAKNMPEIDRATTSFGKHQSQFMNFIMTVSALTPERNMRQILAEIERKREALRENESKIKHQIIEHEEKRFELQRLIDRLAGLHETDEEYLPLQFKIAHLKVDIEKIESDLASARLYYEAALKDVYSYQQAYNEIAEKYDMKNWDEEDFEQNEERYHIMKAFEQAFSFALQYGFIDAGNQEYFKQLGINPIQAQVDIMTYVQDVQATLSENQNANIGIESFHNFLRSMADKYQGCSKAVLEVKGINPKGYYVDVVYKENKMLADKGDQ